MTEPSAFQPDSRPYRFVVLLVVALMLFGSYFAYDSVGAIETTLMNELNVGRSAIGNMYTMYSIAAIFSVLLGGILIDRIGTRRASLIFSVLVTAGAAVVALASTVWGVYAGRLLFGVGSESLVVAQSAILARWFKGKELALAFGIALTVSRLGTLFSFNTESLLAARFGWKLALWAAAGLCGASLLANLIYNALDARAARKLNLTEAAGGDQIVLAELKKGFPPSFWYLTLLCTTFYSAIFPFMALATDFFHSKWNLPNASAEGLGFFQGVFYNLTHMLSTAQGTTSIIITASMFLAPFAGALVDRIGRRASLMILGAFLMIPAHLVLGITDIRPAIPMVILGAAFVLVPAAVWPSVPLIVKEGQVGTAFGLMTMIQNVGMALFPLLSGLLRDRTHDYTASQVMFASLGAVGLICAVLLLRADARSGGALERTRRVA